MLHAGFDVPMNKKIIAAVIVLMLVSGLVGVAVGELIAPRPSLMNRSNPNIMNRNNPPFRNWNNPAWMNRNSSVAKNYPPSMNRNGPTFRSWNNTRFINRSNSTINCVNCPSFMGGQYGNFMYWHHRAFIHNWHHHWHMNWHHHWHHHHHPAPR